MLLGEGNRTKKPLQAEVNDDLPKRMGYIAKIFHAISTSLGSWISSKPKAVSPQVRKSMR